MKKRFMRISITVIAAISFMIALSCTAWAANSQDVSTESDFINAMQDTSNLQINIQSDITVNEAIEVTGGRKTIYLQGHTLTVNKSIIVDEDDYVAINGFISPYNSGQCGSVQGNDLSIFVLKTDSGIATIDIESGMFYCGNGSLVDILGGDSYQGNDTGLIISSGKFYATGNNDIINDINSGVSNVAISGGVFESENSSCLYGGNGMTANISGGSFYSKYANAVYLSNEYGSYMAAGRNCVVNGQCIYDSSETLPQKINYADLKDKRYGDGDAETMKLVQIGADGSFAQVNVLPSTGSMSGMYGVSVLNGDRAYIGAKIYASAGCGESWKFIGWAKNNSYDRDALLSTDSEYSLNVPDSPSVNLYPIFEEKTSISGADVDKISSFVYNGSAHNPIKSVVVDGKTLVEGKDYEISYYGGNVGAGEKDAEVTGIGDYYGGFTVHFVIKKATPTVKITTTSKTAYYKNTKKKAVYTSAIAVSGAKGTKKFVKTGGSKKLSVVSSTGKIRIAKGTRKGTYSIKVKVTSAATANYNAKTSAVKTIKVRVK